MIPLTDILTAARSVPRGDELLAHVSDLYGCDRASWLRRNGFSRKPFSREKLALFAQGLAYEAQVVRDLRAYGLSIRSGVEVTLHAADDDSIVVGHTDIIVDDIVVVDTKLTRLRAPKEHVSPHHAIQVAAYAVALGLQHGIILVYHQGSDIERQYDVDVDALALDEDGYPMRGRWAGLTYREIVYLRVDDVVARTASNAPLPPAEPGDLSPWGCKYCDWTQCARNPNATAEAFA
jgi:hypothetical protein